MVNHSISDDHCKHVDLMKVRLTVKSQNELCRTSVWFLPIPLYWQGPNRPLCQIHGHLANGGNPQRTLVSDIASQWNVLDLWMTVKTQSKKLVVYLSLMIVNPQFLYVIILWRMHYRYCDSVDVGIPFFNKWTKMQTVFVNFQKKWKDFFQKYEVKRDINKVGLLKMAFNRFIIKSFIWATNFIQLIIKNIFKLWSKGN